MSTKTDRGNNKPQHEEPTDVPTPVTIGGRGLSQTIDESVVEPAESKDGPNPFDLNALRAPQDFAASGGVERKQLKIRATDRPPQDKFLRVHTFNPEYEKEEWCLQIMLFTCQFEGDLTPETFLVLPGSEPYDELSEKLKPALVVLGALRGGSKFCGN